MYRHGNLTEEMASAGAKWWADQLRGEAKLDHGDETAEGAITFMLAKIIQRKISGRRSPEDIDRFEKVLHKRLLEYTYFVISVDYDPCKLLSAAGKEAGCDLTLGLPWKTQMFFMEDDSIEVSHGYGAPRKTVFAPTEAQT